MLSSVYTVSYPRFWIVAIAVAVAGAASSDYLSARRKIEQIESDRLKAGTRLELNQPELNAFVEQEAPPGVRNPKVEVLSTGLISGSALIDFNKLRRAQGHEPGWLAKRLLDGEHSVAVIARIESGNGRAQVDVQKAQISGVTIDGRTIDFLIQNFLMPMYPEAVVGQPFEMGHHIDRLDVQPAAVGVVIGR
jgi:hypothetical protein